MLITSRVEILFEKVLAFAQLGGRVTWRLGNLGARNLWVILSFVTISFFFFFHGRVRNIFGYCRAINILSRGRAMGFFTWAFGNLGNLDFGWLELWVTWALSNLGFDNLGNLDIGQLGWLVLWTIWVTWLIIGKFDVLKNLTHAFQAESISGLFKYSFITWT